MSRGSPPTVGGPSSSWLVGHLSAVWVFSGWPEGLTRGRLLCLMKPEGLTPSLPDSWEDLAEVEFGWRSWVECGLN